MKRRYRHRLRPKPASSPDNRAAIIAQGLIYAREELPGLHLADLVLTVADRLVIAAREVAIQAITAALTTAAASAAPAPGAPANPGP